MKTTEIKDIVGHLLGQFDTVVLLVAWPKGIKGGKGVDFRKITLKEMMDPEYRREAGRREHRRCARRRLGRNPLDRH